MTIAVGDPTFIIKDAKQFGLYFQDDWKVSQASDGEPWAPL